MAAAALARAIEVMARLRGPGGCPWDRAQTHASLAKYAIEEAHEVAEAAETGRPADLQEELGDLLLQVLFHAQIAAENEDFTLADVAEGLVAKLIRRHPHVFAGERATTPAQVEEVWAQVKAAEAPRAHPLAGIPAHLPALMRAQKVLSRAEKAGLASAIAVDQPAEPEQPTARVQHETAESIGAALLAVVERAQSAGIDAEQALRGATRTWQDRIASPPTQ